MYVPERFKQTDPEVIRAFIRENPFGILISTDGERQMATHLPLLVAELPGGRMSLKGHMSRQNPQWEKLSADREVLVVIPGPHTYVSAGWYKGNGVPTWNYMSVHAYGTPVLLEGQALYELLDALVKAQESRSSNPGGYGLSGLPDGYVHGMMKGIVGFDVTVSRVEASFKLSQKTDPIDYDTVIRKLKGRSDTDSHRIAEEMDKRRPPAP
jgi:transcriptional regulator